MKKRKKKKSHWCPMTTLPRTWNFVNCDSWIVFYSCLIFFSFTGTCKSKTTSQRWSKLCHLVFNLYLKIILFLSIETMYSEASSCKRKLKATWLYKSNGMMITAMSQTENYWGYGKLGQPDAQKMQANQACCKCCDGDLWCFWKWVCQWRRQKMMIEVVIFTIYISYLCFIKEINDGIMIENMIGIVCPLAWIIASAFLLQDEARGTVKSIPIQMQEKKLLWSLVHFAWHLNLLSMNTFDSNSNINSNSNCNFLVSWTEGSLCWIWICKNWNPFCFHQIWWSPNLNLNSSESKSEFVWIQIAPDSDVIVFFT